MEEIRFAINIEKPVVAIKITEGTSSEIAKLNLPVISKRRNSLESWIKLNI